MLLCDTFTESSTMEWDDSFLGVAQSKEKMELIWLNTEI